ncbi:hypothetical protein BBO99_00001912 [Phytophthora kernoviae]|uniref:Uncharacterized protein n=2 Tax=Phytophthora kernoviae TaxID=325452 RepID=A0A421GYN4_9STRA|nr:hypothetical protein G195_001189 [Phytophthora kernoviae 00238/432]KAG2529232.1 hypothetical protein JM18_001714 [Phytophthora kernoviae]KAG2530000.1 hypothetical protein JM16_001714 [Phytophthora kernoviae]RLN27005.1 hypothetical protein BBI17_001769 [Phytophthora kernoviae]RLN83670.1 hypothetical protein BBO99_00001912 [Phytophthora kernoviae]
MNLFWRSLDTAFFVRKFNKRKFNQLQNQVEDMCGVRLSSSHPEYDQVRELLVMPRRERVPAYLVEFRMSRKQKQTFLSSDIFMGVTSETSNIETEVDEQTALVVGTTVTVAKRTWSGINKLGGVGRIQKVNDKALPDGKKRFTYNVRFVLGGSEKNVERKYISVVDLDAEEAEKTEENSVISVGGRAKAGPDLETKDDTEQSTLNVRLVFDVERIGEEEKLLALPDSNLERPLKRQRFQLQFSTENATVFCERVLDPKADSQRLDNAAPTKELLLHRHFDVKVPDGDAVINECFSSKLLSIEDRVGDEVDEDGSESDDEEDEVKTELAALQEQFRTVMASNEKIFDTLTKKVEEEYTSKAYRQRELQDIQWHNYERMYQELQTAKRQFDDSDDEGNMNEDGRMPSSVGPNAESEEEDSENEDESCGGLFVNKIKQEGNEMCGLCELSGGDFAATDSGNVVHPQCAMFTPETFFKDGIVHGIDQVAPERRRLRKRKNSGGTFSNAKNNQGGSPAIVIDDQELRCARRLDIDELDDDSDHEGKAVEEWQQGRDLRCVFNKNDVVEVLTRDWRGINKPGGVGRVRVVNVESSKTGGKDVFYDVSYVVGGGKEKHVAARFVRSYDQSSAA